MPPEATTAVAASPVLTVMAAVGRDGAIGRGGGLPWRLPADLGRFKRVTSGHVLLMGRRTYESIGRPLPGRITVVVTRRPDWPAGERPTALRVAASLAAALELAARAAAELASVAQDVEPRRVFVQGGAEVYDQALPLADALDLTWVNASVPDADTWFPPVAWADWAETSWQPFDGGVWATYRRHAATG